MSRIAALWIGRYFPRLQFRISTIKTPNFNWPVRALKFFGCSADTAITFVHRTSSTARHLLTWDEEISFIRSWLNICILAFCIKLITFQLKSTHRINSYSIFKSDEFSTMVVSPNWDWVATRLFFKCKTSFFLRSKSFRSCSISTFCFWTVSLVLLFSVSKF